MILTWWVNSSFHVSFCAGILAYSTALYLEVKNAWVFFVFAFLGTWSVYIAQRIFKGKKLGISQIHAHILNLKKYYVPIALITGVAAAGMCSLLGLSYLLLGALGFILSLLYVYIPGKRKGLRNYPIPKLVLVALVWTIVTAIIPSISLFPTFNGLEAQLFFLERFLFILLITIPFDIRDLLRDSGTQKTLPMVLGIKGTRLLMLALLVGLVFLQYYQFQVGNYNFNFTVAMLGIYVLTAVLCIPARVQFSEWYFTFWVEATMIWISLPLLFFESGF